MINETGSGPRNVMQLKGQKLYHSKRVGHVNYDLKNVTLTDSAVFAASWTGLGFQCNRECKCHRWKNQR
jgi:hypothetical protein